MTLRVAVPSKGSLSGPAMELLTDAGYHAQKGHRELRRYDPDNDMLIIYLRPKDIATYVATGDLDVGVTGLDLLVNSGAAAEPILELGFAKARFRFAAPADSPIRTIEDLHGRRLATSFPTLVAKSLAGRGITVDLVTLDGGVENAIELGVADAIADVVETGESLRNAGLVPFGEPLMHSQGVLIQSSSRALDEDKHAIVRGMVERLRGVLNSRKYVVMDYDCPKAALEQACALTPGLESPTISPLADAQWVAVRSLVLRGDVQRVMDQLQGIGARAILVTKLDACRV
ncbi:ATP phosphoribosyltransferase [Kutzneria sp. CA-103260]|uniref:ATP phosphoribosyltransferase n=1 Tax=Kutzneria sp. CA-103260 TaxID=2802641 RepID=UPI001BA89E14|nr:ATP phosphoribosyltransferase [Kutzneria sp. CA-103260]QUQ62406.1 ATP phosphoribosyltransferase [Kutzneria sp. CA-103260]